MAKIAWYSIDKDLKTVDHEPVDLEEALEILRRYHGQLQPHYEWGEEGIAATQFGFAKSEHDFVELRIAAHDAIAIRVVAPNEGGAWYARLWRGPFFEREETVHSPAEAAERIRWFFTMSDEDWKSWVMGR